MPIFEAPTGRSLFVPSLHGPQTGDPKAGLETQNRMGPAYGVSKRSIVLKPLAVGLDLRFRNTLNQATGQAFRSFVNSAANIVTQEGD